jgi:Fe-S cluster assembly iron-binding protein IscA
VSPQESDEVVEHDGARVFLGPIAALKFNDSVLDVRTDGLGRLQFVVRDAA